MTERWVRSARTSILPEGYDKLEIVVVAQGLSGMAKVGEDVRIDLRENEGFAKGMNLGIAAAMASEPDWVIVCNNDCTFPDPHWMKELLPSGAADGRLLVFAPFNTQCNTPCMVAGGPRPAVADIPLSFAPAVCWAVSAWLIEAIRMAMGYELFDPEFELGWAEDNYAAAVIRTLTHKDYPFRVRPASWIKHDGSLTVSHIIKQRKSIEWTKRNEALLQKKLAELEKLSAALSRPTSEPANGEKNSLSVPRQ